MNVVNQVRDLIGLGQGRKPAPTARTARTRAAKPAPAARAPQRAPECTSPSSSGLSGAIGVIELRDTGSLKGGEELGATALSVIKWHVADAGVVKAEGPFRFSVQFASLGSERAQIKLRQIAEALEARLVADTGSTARVVFDELTAELKVRGKSPPVEDQIAALFDKLDEKRKAEAAGWEGQIRTIRKDAHALFMPVWSTQTHLTSMSRCELDLSLRMATFNAFKAAATEEEVVKTQLDLDLMCLKKALLGLYNAKRGRNTPSILVPVSLRVLENPEARDSYFNQLAELPDGFRELLIIEILPHEPTETPDALIAACEAVNVYVDRIALRVSADRDLLRAAATSGAWGFTIDVSKLRPRVSTDIQWVPGLVRMARGVGAEPLALGVQTVGAANAAIEAGISLLSGPAIHFAVPQPRAASRLKPFPHAKS